VKRLTLTVARKETDRGGFAHQPTALLGSDGRPRMTSSFKLKTAFPGM
jgi:hypothetical protein